MACVFVLPAAKIKNTRLSQRTFLKMEERKVLKLLEVHVVEVLGQGQNGCVFRVTYNDEECAAKVGLLSTKIEQEFKLQSSLSHAHCVPAVHFLRCHGYGVILMPVLKPVENLKPLPEYLLARFLRHGLSGVMHLHNAGYAHTDVALRNLLVTESHERLMLSDFGLAQPLSESSRKQDIMHMITCILELSDPVPAWLKTIGDLWANEDVTDVTALLERIPVALRCDEIELIPIIPVPGAVANNPRIMKTVQSLLERVFGDSIQLHPVAGDQLFVWHSTMPRIVFFPQRQIIQITWDHLTNIRGKIYAREVEACLRCMRKRIVCAWSRRAHALSASCVTDPSQLRDWIGMACKLANWNYEWALDGNVIRTKNHVYAVDNLQNFLLDAVPEDKYALNPLFLSWLDEDAIRFIVELGLPGLGLVACGNRFQFPMAPELSISLARLDDRRWGLLLQDKQRHVSVIETLFTAGRFLRDVDKVRGWIDLCLGIPDITLEWMDRHVESLQAAIREWTRNPLFRLLKQLPYLTPLGSRLRVSINKCRVYFHIGKSFFHLTLFQVAYDKGISELCAQEFLHMVAKERRQTPGWLLWELLRDRIVAAVESVYGSAALEEHSYGISLGHGILVVPETQMVFIDSTQVALSLFADDPEHHLPMYKNVDKLLA